MKILSTDTTAGSCIPRPAAGPDGAAAMPDDRDALSALLAGFEGIPLSALDGNGTRLMTREESKHLMTFGQCRELVLALTGSCRVLEILGLRIGRYETVYYDTPSFQSYHAHHNGKAGRCKLRLRHYDASGETYLEIKKKTNKGLTVKNRMKTSWPTEGFLPDQAEFLRAVLPFDWRPLRPVITTVYDRFTLVSAAPPGRITFDMRISFDNGQRFVSFPDLVIAEIKHDKGVKNSLALQKIHAMGISRGGFSKYCIGVSLLYDWLKHNRFKENLLHLARFSRGGGVPC